MPQLAGLDPATLTQNSWILRTWLLSLLEHLKGLEGDSYRGLYNIVDYAIGQLEKCPAASARMDVVALASATRNLFELTFMTEYVCNSPENARRFAADRTIDELDMMDKLEIFDKGRCGYKRSPEVEERRKRSQEQLKAAGLVGERPLLPRDYAEAVERVDDYDELYRFYSKLTHATAWIILGGCNWEILALFTLAKANQYVVQVGQHIARHTGFGK